MINITIIDTYSLKELISRKLKLLEMNIDNKLCTCALNKY